MKGESYELKSIKRLFNDSNWHNSNCLSYHSYDKNVFLKSDNTMSSEKAVAESDYDKYPKEACRLCRSVAFIVRRSKKKGEEAWRGIYCANCGELWRSFDV